MNINFNTTIFAIFGICFGANYWNSNMDDDFGETDLTGETEHCLAILYCGCWNFFCLVYTR